MCQNHQMMGTLTINKKIGTKPVNNDKIRSFKFDKILHNASQESAYEECAAPIMNSVLQGTH